MPRASAATDWLKARIRAIRRHDPATPTNGFKRQVTFRISAGDWPLLEQAASEHGSIQAAILAGIHALTAPPQTPRVETAPPRAGPSQSEDQITAREAARILGLKTGTVSGYIRSGRSPATTGTPGSCGWVTNRAALAGYQQRIQANR